MGVAAGKSGEWRSFWFLPFTASLGYATSVIHVYSMGPFIAPLQEEFGWTRAQVMLGLSVASFISAIFCMPVGILVDRVGPRRVGLVGVLLMTGSFALLSTATGSIANWIFLWVVIALGTLWVQATVWTSAINSRFEQSRGLALAITLSGASLSAALFPALAAWLIGREDGWRGAFVSMAGLWALLVFPMLFLFFRGARDQSRKPDAAPPPARVLTGLSIAEGLRSPTLYKLLMASSLFSFTTIGAVVHFVPILTDSGADRLAAAGVASLIGVFSIVGRLGTGFLLDRFQAQYVGAVAFLLPIVACLLLLSDGSQPLNQAVAAAAIGLTLGSEVDVIAYLAAKHFGLKNFGALYGALVMALSLGTAFGPLAAGAIFDLNNSYVPFLLLAMGLMAASAIALASLGRPPAAVAAPAPAA
ncbi:MAG TPA: MFS transporter [Solimonas sp.]